MRRWHEFAGEGALWYLYMEILVSLEWERRSEI